VTSNCYYNVAITVDSSLPGCQKEDDKSISHVCWQQGADAGSVCPTTTPSVDFWADELTKGATLFTTYYNVGSQGGKIYFVTKDANACSTSAEGVTFSVDVMDAGGKDTGLDASVLCQPEPNDARGAYRDVVSTKC